MLTDIEIAQSAELKPIGEIAAKLGLGATDIEPYGHYKAKVPLDVINGRESRNGKLVLVTGISPTPAGEGKSTVAVGLADALTQADLVVNPTPVGMASASNPDAAEACPLNAAELSALQGGASVYDIIYTPRPTQLLQRATCRSFDGLEMLVEQGAAALRLWSGLPEVPVEVMRQALLEHLP